MRMRDLFYETWQALTANKGRSLLTILGIVIGIAAVIAMTALIGGVKNSIIGELGLNQSRVLYMYVSNANRQITFEDLDQIQQNVPGYEYVTGTVMSSASISSQSESGNALVYGIMPEYFEVSGSKLAQGRYFTAQEEESSSMMVVLDQNAVKDLFGNASAQVVGKSVHIGNDDYTIIGVIESTSLMGSSGNETVYLPYSTTLARIAGTGVGISQIMGYAQEGTDVESLSTRTTDYLARYFNIPEAEKSDSVQVMSMQSVINELNTTMAAFQLMMTAVAGISLFVGGIGIMNMMLTNVTERIREIGLRKALGARRRAITQQFLLEAIMLCVAGGIIGILVGYLGAWGLAAAVGAYEQGLSVTPAISLQTVLIAVGICIGIGIVFGYYPARRAAKLDPVESLRYQ